MNSGAFSGTDQRDLIRDAITWWEAQLDFLDEKLEEQKKTALSTKLCYFELHFSEKPCLARLPAF
jgi:hypothetical protein